MTESKFSGDQIVPVEIKQAGDFELGIRWKDGHQSTYRCDYLRKHCACAGCVDEWTGASLIAASSIPKDIRPSQIKSVGRYGIQFFWSDGHSTGIYTFERLRELCPCPSCQGV